MSTEQLIEIAKTSEALKWISDRTDSFKYPEDWDNKVPLKVHMLLKVKSDFAFMKDKILIAERGAEYYVKVNSYGAVTAILEDGQLLGLKPDEFEVIEWHPNLKSMKYLLKKLSDHISENGDGEYEFHARDIERLLRKTENLLEIKNRQLKYLGTNRMGVNYHRVAENEEHGYNKTEKAFSDQWRKDGYGNLSSILSSAATGFQVKVTPKVNVVAATVTQWLGSNVGMTFLSESLKRAGLKIVEIKTTENNDEHDSVDGKTGKVL